MTCTSGWLAQSLFVVLCALTVKLSTSIDSSSCQVSKDVQEVKFLIVGAGPGGVQWGQLLEEADVNDYVILEGAQTAGSKFDVFPRSRRLFGYGKGKDLRENQLSLKGSKVRAFESDELYPDANLYKAYIQEIASNLHIEYNTTVHETKYITDRHLVTSTDGRQWSAEHLVIATGMQPKENFPPCFDLFSSHVDKYTPLTMPPVETGDDSFCKDADAFIFGSGATAFELADELAPCARTVTVYVNESVRFAHLTHYFGDVRMKQMGIFDREQMGMPHRVLSINTSDIRTAAPVDGYEYSVMLDRLFKAGLEENMTQHVIDSYMTTSRLQNAYNINDTCAMYRKVELMLDIDGSKRLVVFAGGLEANVDVKTENERYPLMGPWWSDVNEPNKWYAGSLMHGLDYRKSSGGFVHGYRSLIYAQVRRLLNGGKPTHHIFYNETDAYLHALSRMTSSDGLFHMPGWLHDVIVPQANETRNGGQFLYYEDIPSQWILGNKDQAVRLEINYANVNQWTPDLIWKNSRLRQDPGLALHPIVSSIINGSVMHQFHVPEDNNMTWTHQWYQDECLFALTQAHLHVQNPTQQDRFPIKIQALETVRRIHKKTSKH